jgi:hypothetical protein
MWTTLALMTLTMAPAQTGAPEFKNVRYTLSLLGQNRKSDKYLPGDVVVLAFDLENMTVKKDGRVLYSIGLEVSRKGKAILTREPQDMETVNSLGTGTFPSLVFWPIPRDSDTPGEYTIKTTITDRATKKSTTLTRKFEVLKPQLGFIQVQTTSVTGDALPPYGVPGQRINLRYQLTGFEFAKDTKLTNLNVTIRILDSEGKPTLARPHSGDIKTDAKNAPGVMILSPYQIDLNRPGKFKIELKANDKVSGKSAELTLDLTVMDNR